MSAQRYMNTSRKSPLAATATARFDCGSLPIGCLMSWDRKANQRTARTSGDHSTDQFRSLLLSLDFASAGLSGSLVFELGCESTPFVGLRWLSHRPPDPARS